VRERERARARTSYVCVCVCVCKGGFEGKTLKKEGVYVQKTSEKKGGLGNKLDRRRVY
jgi:hypothetical protein